MDNDAHRSVSLRASRRPDRSNYSFQIKGGGDGFFGVDKSSSDYPIKVIWKRGFVRLLLVGGILWMLLILAVLLFHIWTCQSSLVFLSAICNKDSTVFQMLHTMGLVTPPHRCSIPLANDPEKVVIPEKRSPSKFVQSLSYFGEDDANTNGSQSPPLFGGHQSWKQREDSFKLKSSMKVHCGFMKNGGAEMSPKDVEYVKKCKFVVASGIFDGYDTPHQPSNVSPRSKKLFCFLMVVDEISLDFIKKNVSVRNEEWVGIWRLVLLKNPPYDEPRRNGKVPKILTHRLFPQALYSIWIDGKMELIVDPLLMLERYLWRGKYTFAIAQHKHHKNIYEEADSNKRRKRYARPLIDHHMKIYRYEGLEPWTPLKQTKSGINFPKPLLPVQKLTANSSINYQRRHLVHEKILKTKPQYFVREGYGPKYAISAGRRNHELSLHNNDGKEPFWLAPTKDFIRGLKSVLSFLAEQPSQLKYIEWPGFQNTLKTAVLTLVLVAMLIVVLSSVDSGLWYLLTSILRKPA